MLSATTTTHRYGFGMLIILALLAELEAPGTLPRPKSLLNALIGLTCALLLVHALITTGDFFEHGTWFWQVDGFVWPWQAWLWRATAYSTSPPATPTPTPRTSRFTFSMPPPSSTLIIPPTPQLPLGMRRPLIGHASGLMGPSPVPVRSKAFEGGECVHASAAMTAWRWKAKTVVPEKRGSEGDEEENPAKKMEVEVCGEEGEALFEDSD
jgi:hypothetical protein